MSSYTHYMIPLCKAELPSFWLLEMFTCIWPPLHIPLRPSCIHVPNTTCPGLCDRSHITTRPPLLCHILWHLDTFSPPSYSSSLPTSSVSLLSLSIFIPSFSPNSRLNTLPTTYIFRSFLNVCLMS